MQHAVPANDHAFEPAYRPDAARASIQALNCNVRCTASELLRWGGLAELADSRSEELHFALRRVLAEQTLIHEGQGMHALYLVAAGSFKFARTDLEGYEQVLGFGIHGDMLGLDGLGQSQHSSATVALEDSTVVVLPYADWQTLSQQVPALSALLHHAAGIELQHRGHTQYLMSAASAEVRVARFLLHFAQRQQQLGHSDRRLHLRMTRRDIASCLCVAHETVSRALTALVAQGCIRVCNRDVEILNPEYLQTMQRVTRGAPRGRAAVLQQQAKKPRVAKSNTLFKPVLRAGLAAALA